MLKSKQANVDGDLDIVKFLRDQRFTKICLSSLLTEDQRKFTSRLADSVLGLSSDSSDSSDASE